MGYNTPRTSFNNFHDFVYKGGAPVTNGLLIANVFAFVTAFFLPSLCGQFYVNWIALSLDTVKHAPWTLVTYPLFTPSPTTVLLSGYVLWWVGGSLERSWGSRTYFNLVLALSAISGLSILLGCMLLGAATHASYNTVMVTGLSLLVSGLLVAFCAMNPNQIISMIVCQVKAKYISLITVAFCWINFGPALGFFACGGCLASYLYIKNRPGFTRFGGFARQAPRGPDLRMNDYRSGGGGGRSTLDGSRNPSPFDLVGQWKERQERKRLERLFKSSRLPKSDRNWQDDERR